MTSKLHLYITLLQFFKAFIFVFVFLFYLVIAVFTVFQVLKVIVLIFWQIFTAFVLLLPAGGRNVSQTVYTPTKPPNCRPKGGKNQIKELAHLNITVWMQVTISNCGSKNSTWSCSFWTTLQFYRITGSEPKCTKWQKTVTNKKLIFFLFSYFMCCFDS